jgi:hypothetical protein
MEAEIGCNCESFILKSEKYLYYLFKGIYALAYDVHGLINLKKEGGFLRLNQLYFR